MIKWKLLFSWCQKKTLCLCHLKRWLCSVHTWTTDFGKFFQHKRYESSRFPICRLSDFCRTRCAFIKFVVLKEQSHFNWRPPRDHFFWFQTINSHGEIFKTFRDFSQQMCLSKNWTNVAWKTLCNLNSFPRKGREREKERESSSKISK